MEIGSGNGKIHLSYALKERKLAFEMSLQLSNSKWTMMMTPKIHWKMQIFHLFQFRDSSHIHIQIHVGVGLLI